MSIKIRKKQQASEVSPTDEYKKSMVGRTCQLICKRLANQEVDCKDGLRYHNK